ncbi:MAG TPA: NAD(P)/FAD-dependent oxidoreductase [bacterium]|nr:NAD(P)/FAD-dependent oxidoreductase [bacterium]
MTETADVVIVGAGQAGLSLSYELRRGGVEHLIIERGRVAETWRGRWNSFCLVIPNWTVQLPGYPYGGDPDGFMPRDEIVAHLAAYAGSFRAPVREGVVVTALEPHERGGFALRTASGEIRARHVVLATGAYQKPYRPAAAAQLPPSVHAIDAEGYTRPSALPDGPVLVVGSGQTGCQLAEELREAGRETYLSCGRAPWVPRRLEGRDIMRWIVATPWMEMTPDDLPSPLARLGANIQTSGRDGGHDCHYRTLHAQGVRLLGHLTGVEDGTAYFAPDVAHSVAFGDERYGLVCGLIRKACAARGVAPPEMPAPPPFRAEPVGPLPLDHLGAVVFTSGFRPDYGRWVWMPEAFDEMGFPIQHDGSSTVVRGLHFMGVHFQRKRKSATFLGLAEDAAILAEAIVSTKR